MAVQIIEKRIQLPHKFEPRFYQLPLILALERGIKRAVAVWHRRAGKDKVFTSIMCQRCAQRVGIHYYYLPTATMARKIIWDGIDGTGFKFLDHFPNDFIVHVNNQEMKITFANGSIFQMVGTDDFDRVVGTNPVTTLFSEFSLQNPQAWTYVRPILAENGGVALFNGTPRGKNHLYYMLQNGINNPKWFAEVLTVDDTFAISQEAIQDEHSDGMSEQMVQQEFYCDFEVGDALSYFCEEMKLANEQGRIGYFEYDPAFPVYTFWDLGMGNRRGSDSLCIIFCQFIDDRIKIIDDFEGEGKKIKEYIDIVNAKPYKYGAHYAPHDSDQRTLQTGMDLISFCLVEYGFRFEHVQRTSSKQSNIFLLRSLFHRLYMHKDNAARVIECITAYHEKMDKNGVRTGSPEHDWSSDMSDTMLLMALAVQMKLIRNILNRRSNRMQSEVEPAGSLI